MVQYGWSCKHGGHGKENHKIFWTQQDIELKEWEESKTSKAFTCEEPMDVDQQDDKVSTWIKSVKQCNGKCEYVEPTGM